MGRIDHGTSGDTKNKLDKSINLVRDFSIQVWNIIPEMARLYKKDVFHLPRALHLCAE